MKTTKTTIETLASMLLEYTEQTPEQILQDVEAGAYPQDITIYNKGKRYAEDGSYLVSGYDAHALIKDLYNESEAEASKYTNFQAWEHYLHLMGRAIELLEREARA